MRREPHPASGLIYEEVGEGVVLITDEASGKQGKFRYDGLWLEGDLKQADPHYLNFIGGPTLPPGKDIYWAMLPPVFNPEDKEELPGYSDRATLGGAAPPPKVIAGFTGDPGRETEHGPRSSTHMDLAFLLEHDRKPELVPEAYWLESPMGEGPKRISSARFHEKRFHDLEVERLWKRTWQMACRVDDIPEIGDYHVYEIAHLSFLILRTGEDSFKGYYNACLHRGQLLKDKSGKGAKDLRCPYHGWTWGLEGELKVLPCEWDLPGVREDVSALPGVQVATWGGFVFINPDLDAEPLEEFLGPVMIDHYKNFKFENRYKQAHVSKVIPANWKIAQEAFMEAYHIASTHPQLLLAGSDSADMRYDVFGNWGRAMHGSPSISSPLRGRQASDEQILTRWRALADATATYLGGLIGDEVDQYSDAELNDGSFNDLFPNLHPWGGWARIVFRFRPLGDDPDHCLMEVMLLAPWPEGKPKPPAARVQELTLEQSWCDAPQLGTLARILDQDMYNIARVHAGIKAKKQPYIWYAAYQESKIRNFHRNYERKLGIVEAE